LFYSESEDAGLCGGTGVTHAVQVTVRFAIVFEWLSISDINNCPFAEVFLSIRKGVGFGVLRGHSQQ